MENSHLYSTISASTYKRNKKDRQKYLKMQGINNYSIDNELSNKYHSVYINNDNNNVVFGIRGTDVKDFGDLITDSALLFDLQAVTPRFRKAQNHLKKVQEKYKDKNITLTGHSLGGSISEQLAKTNNLKAHVFNKGSSPFGLNQRYLESLISNKGKDNVTSYITVGDSISNSSIFDPSTNNVIISPNDDLKNKSNPFYYHNIRHFHNTRIQ